MMTRPLDGVRVLDLSRLFPGPYATLLLSDLGAEVTKIEDPNGGDYIRYFPPFCADGSGAPFHALNRGKKSVALDLRGESGKAAFRAMLKTADVLVESFRPGVMEKLGLVPEELLEAFPRLIICRISGYGQKGDRSKRAGHDLNYAARAGALGLMKEPHPLPVQVGDLCGGAWPAAFQIVSALYHRVNSGKGAIIDVSMTDGTQSMLLLPLARRQVEDAPLGDGVDMLVGAVPAYDVYETKDGYLSVGALEPKFWARFCDAIGIQDLVGSAFSTGEEGEEVRHRIREKLKERTAVVWCAHFAGFDCCVEAVRSPEDVADNLSTAGPALAKAMDIGGAQVHMPVPALDLARGNQPDQPCSPLGADTKSVLQGLDLEPAVRSELLGSSSGDTKG
jgi:alpha-methylacyl-CoA racemase